MRRRTLVLAAIPILLTPLAGCPSEEEEEETPTQGEVETPDGPLSGELDVGAWEIPEDLAVEVVGDLVVRSSAAIRVDGELRAAAGSGFTIILDAADTLTVAGTVAAGDGADGELGGAVVLAAGSDVVLEAGAEVAAGSGGDGIVDEDTLGQAADGGDVSFLAGGTLDIDPAATVTIGDGGDGAELRVQPDDLPDPETWNVLRAPNGGGASGGLELAFGDTTLAVTVHESGEAIVRDDGSVLVEEDEPFLELDESSEGIFGGGEAGDPGAFLYGDDADGESNWPGGEASITEWVDDGRDTPQPKEIVGQNGRPAMARTAPPRGTTDRGSTSAAGGAATAASG